MQKACREESCREDESLLPSSRSPGCRDLQVTFRAPRDLCKALRRWPALLLSSACGAAFLVVGFLVWPRQLRANDSDLWSVARADAQQEGGIRGRAPTVEDYCGKVEEDTEYHTEHHLYWIGNIANQDVCCAQCDAEPECAAWTYGRVQGVPGLSGHCYLKKLGEGEEPETVHRPGVVSGRISQKLRKHGIVAKLLAKEEGTPQKDTRIKEGETCPGTVSVAGHGLLSVVSALWKWPGERATHVEVPTRDWAIVPHLDSRAYLAENCTPGEYHSDEYAAFKLLGGHVRYTTDLSNVGCGCNAQLHLLPMRQSTDKGKCGDFFCHHGWSHCGPTCAEIGLQDSNQYAWSSQLHVRDDTEGVSAGYGGGSTFIGRRSWDDTEYGPGARCIDTTWPFDVEISFPVDSEGVLKAMEVTLSQGGPCTVTGRIDEYAFAGRDGLSELSKVLEAGVTPVVSYWSSAKMKWMDGMGTDAKGPCAKDAPEACPESVRFYNFAVAQHINPQSSSLKSPIESAMAVVHEEVEIKVQRERDNLVADIIANEDAHANESFNITNTLGKNCSNDCLARTPSGDAKEGDEVREPREGGQLRYGEEAEDNTEWEVLVIKVYVHNGTNSSAQVIGEKLKGQVVIGKLVNGWIQLAHEPGYVPVTSGVSTLLKKRIVSYKKLVKGTCQDAGMFIIEDTRTCATAAFALGYFDTEVTAFRGNQKRPPGCYVHKGQVYVSDVEINRDNGADDEREPICSSKFYPTTTTTTTTTSSTTTTTTWGWPSLFCIEVVRTNGYELPLVKEQQKRRVSIFACDEYAVFSDGGKPQPVGEDPGGAEIMTIVIPPIKESIGNMAAGATTNSWLNTKTFLQVWDLAKKDGRIEKHDWTVKVDPDAVFFPDRLRTHLASHTNKDANLYVMNCNRFAEVALYGSIEIFSKKALETYLAGQDSCRRTLPWQGWGEDFFMSHCMDMLRVGRVYDFGLLSDKRCFYSPCSDTSKVVYHDYKDASPHGAWFQCYDQSIHR